MEEHLPGTSGQDSLPSLRIWLARSIIHKIALGVQCLVSGRPGIVGGQLQTRQVRLSELLFFMKRQSPLAPIIKCFPQIGRLDVFHGLGRRFELFERLRGYDGPEMVRPIATSLGIRNEFDELEVLEMLLQEALAEKENARFWHRHFQTRRIS